MRPQSAATRLKRIQKIVDEMPTIAAEYPINGQMWVKASDYAYILGEVDRIRLTLEGRPDPEEE